jgi:hypothetical protein
LEALNGLGILLLKSLSSLPLSFFSGLFLLKLQASMFFVYLTEKVANSHSRGFISNLMPKTYFVVGQLLLDFIYCKWSRPLASPEQSIFVHGGLALAVGEEIFEAKKAGR